jgi:hypothetical protein
MKKSPVLNFNQFHRIFEAGETPQDAVQLKAIDIVINIFFEIYGTLATRTGGYKESIQDYQAIANSENDKRGELMVQTIDKIASLVVKRNPSFSGPVDEYKKSMEYLKQAYDKILQEDKGQLVNIQKKIKDMIIDYLQNLVSNVNNTKLPEIERKNESIEYVGEILLEKDLYQRERIRLIKSLLPLKVKTEELSNKSIFPEIKSIAKSSLKKYNSIIKILQDDNIFDKKKRIERAEEIENQRFSALSIENDLNNALSKIAIKYGVAKEIDSLLKKSLSSLSNANTSLEELEKKKSIEAEKNKIEDSKEKTSEEKKDQKKGEYKEITEKGKNPEDVKSLKKKINSILPKNSALEENGEYDKSLKDSLSKITRVMKSMGIVKPDYKEDSSNISPEFQKYLDEYIKRIDQIKKELPKV